MAQPYSVSRTQPYSVNLPWRQNAGILGQHWIFAPGSIGVIGVDAKGLTPPKTEAVHEHRSRRSQEFGHIVQGRAGDRGWRYPSAPQEPGRDAALSAPALAGTCPDLWFPAAPRLSERPSLPEGHAGRLAPRCRDAHRAGARAAMSASSARTCSIPTTSNSASSTSSIQLRALARTSTMPRRCRRP